MPFRTYLRVALIVLLAVLAWRHYASVSTTRLIIVGLGVLVLIGVIFQMSSLLRKSRKQREEVPKNPLGLE